MTAMCHNETKKPQILKIQNISATLTHKNIKFKALNQVSLNIHLGQHTAILGPNGAGKSTLLEIIGGYMWADAESSTSKSPSSKCSTSEIIWFDPDYPLKPETSPIYARAASRLISPMQQENYLKQAWNISGLELILTGFENSPLLYTASNHIQDELVKDLAKSLDIMHLLARKIKELSQGQLRILLLAKALVCKPNILLLDEYLDGLDQYARAKILDYLNQISADLTIILTIHRKAYLPSWIKQIVLLEQGKIINISTIGTQDDDTLTASPKSNAQPKIDGEILNNFVFDSIDNCQNIPSTDCHTINHVEDYLKQQSISQANTIIKVTNANIFIERQHVLHNIDWVLKHGEHWQITGNNGSGKSTFLRLLARDEYPAHDGHIEYFFMDKQGCPTLALETNYIKQKVHIVSDLAQSLYHYKVTAEEVILSAFDASIGVYREFTAQEYEEANYWLSIVGMESYAKNYLHKLSTGQARRIFLARALIANPKVLLLDEPFSGLDDASHQNIVKILELICQKNIQTVLVSHYQEDKLKYCNRIAHMDNGKLLIIK